MEWILTKDHVPSFEECVGKAIVYHYEDFKGNERLMALISRAGYHTVFEIAPLPDRYILIEIPEYVPVIDPVPCRVCGCTPSVDGVAGDYHVICDATISHAVTFVAPTRDEAVKLWNKYNS